MSSEWSECSLGDLIDIKHGFAFSGDYISKNQGKFVLVTPGNFEIGGGFKDGSAKFFHGQYPEEYVFSPGDLVVTMTDLSKTADTLGYSAKIPGEKGKTYLHNQRVGKVSSKSSDAELDFLYWVMRHTDYRRWVLSTATGSTVKHTSPSRILDYTFLLPPLPEQKAIAHILGTLDDKIELNRKTNETLEAMAKTLFKSWFVDFDPVRAKAEGRPTGLPAEISDLFPDSFEDSELGEIPSGWKISNLGSLIKQCGEPIQASSTTMELPYVPIDCISNKSLALREYKSGAEANTSLLLFREGDLLFGAMRPYFHKVCIAPFDGTTRTTCFALRPFTDSHYAFVAMLLSAASTIEYATLHSTGSTIPYIRWSNGLENMLSIQPPYPILDCFNKTALPILRKISISLFTERPIAAVRDILLPKLISGEIRIPDAEKMLEEVGV
jgi:type I restriction enzyme S subunit